MFRKTFALLCLVAMVAAGGCAGLSVQSTAGKPVALPDGSVLVPVGTFVQAEGTQLVSKDSVQCQPDKRDTDGKPTTYKDCAIASSGNVGDDSPGAKAGKIAGEVGKGALIGGGAAAAGALMRPSKVSQTGASTATTGAVTNTNKASSGAQSTGALTGSGSSATNTVSNP